nr:site-specific integrase [Granulosicoccus sp.]
MSGFLTAVDDYLNELRVARRASPHTISNYHRDLKAVASAAKARNILSWQALQANDIRAIVAEQHREGIAGRSLARRLSAVRGLFNYLVAH